MIQQSQPNQNNEYSENKFQFTFGLPMYTDLGVMLFWWVIEGQREIEIMYENYYLSTIFYYNNELINVQRELLWKKIHITLGVNYTQLISTSFIKDKWEVRLSILDIVELTRLFSHSEIFIHLCLNHV